MKYTKKDLEKKKKELNSLVRGRKDLLYMFSKPVFTGFFVLLE